MRHLAKMALVRPTAVATFILFLGLAAPFQGQEIVALPGESPLIDLRIQFKTGAVDDPVDREGLAYLTAESLAEGSTQFHTYQELLQLFYPWATEVETTVDKERVTFSATVHRDHLEAFTPLLIEMLGSPKFGGPDLERLREQAKNHLTQELRVNNDEELGKEVLYLQIYPASHGYGHHNVGTVSGLSAITEEDLQRFYRSNFQPDRLVVGVAGGYPQGFPEQLVEQLKRALPENTELLSARGLDKPAPPDGRRVTIVEKDTRSVAMSMGFPIEVNRSHPDWAALFLFASFLGEHRSSNSYLYQRLREARGLNYGDYAYIEYFPDGMYLTQPEPNYPRSQQIFQIWIRPVQPETALFTLRATFFELERLLRDGLTSEQFEATRSFLKKNAPLLVASSSRRLGYTLDSNFYDARPFVEHLRRDLDALTLDQVNAAVRRHIQAEDMEIVLVSKDGEALKSELLRGEASPMKYNSEKPEIVLKEDRIIQNYPLKLDEVTVVPVSSFFR